LSAVGHIDANYYYAQIEAIFRPALRGTAYVVGGDRESRKGIVLTKSPLAKRAGVKTGVSIAEALRVMPGLTVLPANYPLYLHFTRRMREIVTECAGTIRPFGLDEMWCSLPGGREEALETVNEIRRRLWRQLCLTVSVGVADNLPYAKLGSDLAPADGVCELWGEEKERKVYPLPVSDLLYVGSATAEKLNRCGIHTIGGLARAGPGYICRILRSKTGESLWAMAAGQDTTPVASGEGCADIKTIGNSHTMPRDLITHGDVKAAFYRLAESVAKRMRENGFEARTVKISVRDNALLSFERQAKLPRPTNLAAELVPAAMELFGKHYAWHKPIRSLGIRGADLAAEGGGCQLDMFEDAAKRQKLAALERCADRLRGRYGPLAARRGVLIAQRPFKGANAFFEEDCPIFYSY
jgi:DNA polymerase-4